MSITPQGIDTSSDPVRTWNDAGCPIDGPLAAGTPTDPVNTTPQETASESDAEEVNESTTPEAAE